jgi:altronate dehydratase large subunit
MMQTDTFMGFPRPDGTHGVRNHVVILSAMDISNPTARRIAANVPGTVPLCAAYGRGLRGDDLAQHTRTMLGLSNHPNVAAALVVSLERQSAQNLADGIAVSGRPAEWVGLQEIGGSIKAVEAGTRIAAEMVAEASRMTPEPVPWREFVLGVECGGSDTTSGVAANPAVGRVADRIVDLGGTVILAETTELIGGEQFLLQRAASSEVADALRRAIARWEDEAQTRGFQLTNLGPDNIRGGLSTMEEKSLGAILKGGTTPLREVVAYGQRPTERGLVFMDTPGPGTESITGIAAGGAHCILFTTGLGNPLGNPVSPTIKVTGNPHTVEHMGDNLDADVSALMTGNASLEQVADGLFEVLAQVANGRLTTAEVLGDVEIAISRTQWLTA